MPGMHCISHSSKQAACSRGAARLDGVGQLLGDALGDLAQLAQRPTGLQARQRARQRAHRALVLPVVLRRQRHLRSSAPLQSHFLYFCRRASVPDSAPTGLWFFPLYCVGSDTCAAALLFNLTSYVFAGAPACPTARPPGSGSSRCTASAATPAQQRSPSISLPLFLQARQRARQRAHRALVLPVVLRRQRHLRSSAPLQSRFLYLCRRASVPDSAPTGLWFFPLYCVGSDTCAAMRHSLPPSLPAWATE